ncbi:MAG: tetratricopeptide repeat protein [Pseudomonadales bacterium]
MHTFRSLFLLALYSLTLNLHSAHAAEFDEEVFSSARRATIEAQKLMEDEQTRAAESLLAESIRRFPSDAMLLATYGDALFNLERYGEAEAVLNRALRIRDLPLARNRLADINEKFEQYTRNLNMAVIVMQKNTDAGNYDTTVAISDRAISKFPDRAIVYNARGEALYRKGDLEAAEAAFRKSLQIDPFNKEARDYVEEIRTTSQARTSTELAEWISIAKDKVGDFIVTFLALFTAFAVNSAIAPVALRIKLRNARKLFEQGKYDEFTDLLEGLLDQENFVPLRANFRFMLRHQGLHGATEILNKYVNTVDRLPTLLRILERENEKMREEG